MCTDHCALVHYACITVHLYYPQETPSTCAMRMDHRVLVQFAWLAVYLHIEQETMCTCAMNMDDPALFCNAHGSLCIVFSVSWYTVHCSMCTHRYLCTDHCDLCHVHEWSFYMKYMYTKQAFQEHSDKNQSLLESQWLYKPTKVADSYQRLGPFISATESFLRIDSKIRQWAR